MIRTLTALGALALFLSACGVDGEPEPPAPKPGIAISGTASSGVTGSL